jgi:oxygen-dependent protoporphyrinogen oxidase
MNATTTLPAPPATAGPTHSPGRVAILGGGLTGLVTAWQLRRQGVAVTVFEAGPAPGGVMASVRDGEWLAETGPNTLFENSPAISGFIDALGLGSRRLAAAPTAQRRYVVRGGRPVTVPDSPPRFVTTRLLSWRAKFQALGEPFRGRAPADADESIADFVVRRLGREFLDYIVNPFVAGVFAGDPAQLSVRHAFPKLQALEQKHGSLIRGSLARHKGAAAPRGSMISFPDGLAEVPRALAASLGSDLRLNHRVVTVRRTGPAWQVEYLSPQGIAEETFSAVVCALPPRALVGVAFAGVPSAAALGQLSLVALPPVASVFLGYRREDVAHPLDGFGVLTPEVEKRRILGTLFSSTLFPGRAPAGHVALTTFVGGTRQPELARLSDRELTDTVQEELERLLGVRGAPVKVRIQRWPQAITQYTVGFQRFKDACASAEAGAPGLFIGGTCRDGVSLSQCIAAGERLATAARAHVSAA